MLRAQLEAALAGKRAASPFTDLGKRVPEQFPSGIAALDSALGGLPRGAITEIVGGASSGKTSTAAAIAASITAQDEVCAWIDGADTFDPESAAAAGIDLSRLLWVRCRTLGHVLRSADLLLQGGGFGLVVLDLSELPQAAVATIPPGSWFRLQRTIENSQTILLLITREHTARSAAALVVETCMTDLLWIGKLFRASSLELRIVRSRNLPFSKARHYVRVDSCS
jgi:hypothetical protein